MAQGTSPRKRVVIVGGGFGGLAVARALRHACAWVMLIDRSNHLARGVIVAPVSVA
jgi:NADH:ubiquinone reductase (H+-translocating)